MALRDKDQMPEQRFIGGIRHRNARDFLLRE